MALVRVKRSIEEDPVSALLVTTKKRKTTDDVESFVFKYAATCDKDGEGPSIQSKINSDKVFKVNPISVKEMTEKLRKENKLHSSNSRWEVVSCFRRCNGFEQLEEPEEETSPKVLINLVPKIESENKDWVYDYYYTNKLDICDSSFDNILSAMPVESELVFDFENESDEELFEADEDSNSEGNWRNDYPEEENDSRSDVTEDFFSEDDYSGNEENISDCLKLGNMRRKDLSPSYSSDEQVYFDNSFDYHSETDSVISDV